jgi:5'-3' exoribonuclease 1
MGIPSYFKHVIVQYRHVLTEYKNNKHVDNLYLDSQSLIYDAVKIVTLDNKDNKIVENEIMKEVVNKLKEYINKIQPKKVLIAFDGVAPVAKLRQQRNRRYRSQIEKKLHFTLGLKKDETWNTIAITPGTEFMQKLNILVKKSFMYPKKYGVDEIIVSDTNQVGEGEHKIFEYIRKYPEYHKTTSTAIYGMDADLFMLTLNHLSYSNRLYLFRETPHFIKTIDSTLLPDCTYMIDIYAMATSIANELGGGEDHIRDYIVLCFFLGNDFMPHFPSLNIRTNGINYLTDAYKQVLTKFGNITSVKGIVWKNMRELIKILAGKEEMYIQGEDNIRNKQEKRTCSKEEDPILFSVNNIPLTDRCKEKYINPYEYGWKERYYSTLLDTERNECSKKQICINYLEGLEWTFKYYLYGCPDWEWSYNYNYPPLLCDLKEYVPYFDVDLIENKQENPISPIVQLAYVLPPDCLHYLPTNVQTKLIKTVDESVTIEYSYCRYFWECHVKTPNVNIKELKNLLI